MIGYFTIFNINRLMFMNKTGRCVSVRFAAPIANERISKYLDELHTFKEIVFTILLNLIVP